MSEYFNPSINYAIDERSLCEDPESLQESVQLMCQMWNDIANEFDNQRSDSALPFRKLSKSALEQITQRSSSHSNSLCPKQVKNIIDMNMACEPQSDIEYEIESASEEEDAISKALYDDMFELR
jgi:hypothetical protein